MSKNCEMLRWCAKYYDYDANAGLLFLSSCIFIKSFNSNFLHTMFNLEKITFDSKCTFYLALLNKVSEVTGLSVILVFLTITV